MIVTKFGQVTLSKDGRIEHSGFEFVPSYYGEPNTKFGQMRAIQRAVAEAKKIAPGDLDIIK